MNAGHRGRLDVVFGVQFRGSLESATRRPTSLLMIAEPDLPEDALLRRYKPEDGHYTDCFRAEMPREVSLAAYVEAFYTARLFRIERAILRLTGQGRSTDAEAAAVAIGTRASFAAWTVEDRTTEQLLCAMPMGQPAPGSRRRRRRAARGSISARRLWRATAGFRGQ